MPYFDQKHAPEAAFPSWLPPDPPTHIYGTVGTHMKTTIELPDELFIAAKKRAAELRCTLRTLIERGLRRELLDRKRDARAKRRPIRWVTVRGGLPPGLDVRDRAAMHDWLKRRA
jgi:hypothetical protein